MDYVSRSFAFKTKQKPETISVNEDTRCYRHVEARVRDFIREVVNRSSTIVETGKQPSAKCNAKRRREFERHTKVLQSYAQDCCVRRGVNQTNQGGIKSSRRKEQPNGIILRS